MIITVITSDYYIIEIKHINKDTWIRDVSQFYNLLRGQQDNAAYVKKNMEFIRILAKVTAQHDIPADAAQKLKKLFLDDDPMNIFSSIHP